MYWSPNFLAVVFKKQEISQQVVTRMQDLASEFSKIFPGPSQPEGATPPAPNTQPGPWPGAVHKLPGVGTQTLVPSTLQPYGCAPDQEQFSGTIITILRSPPPTPLASGVAQNRFQEHNLYLYELCI